jgi:hypothetical protein
MKKVRILSDIAGLVCSTIVTVVGYLAIGGTTLTGMTWITGIILMVIGIVTFGIITTKLVLLTQDR